jgi:signal transduction histidine kinase
VTDFVSSMDADALRLEVQRLNAELEETNRGVLALYAELDDRAEELRRASEYKSRFLSVISHELRTPLTSVLNLSRLLLDRTDGELTPEQERQIKLIRNSVQSLAEMVNELLDLARIEAGKTMLRITTWSAADMIAGVRGVFRPVLGNEAVALVFDDPDPMLRLVTDEGKVSQVLRNFVANAVKFTERGEIRLTTETHADQVTFAVSDTGIGIAPADQSRIFEEFVQADNPRQRYVKGTGLGLALSRRIAHLLGGSVGVRSELDVGSTFWLTIPRVHAHAAADGGEVVVEAAAIAPAGVLARG